MCAQEKHILDILVLLDDSDDDMVIIEEPQISQTVDTAKKRPADAFSGDNDQQTKKPMLSSQ